MTGLIQTAPHEFTANCNYADGLAPYFALDSVVKRHDGTHSGEFEHEGESWGVTLDYQDSGIVHPGDATPTGTPFDIEELREFRLSVQAVDDHVGERSFNVHVRPRWDGMAVESDDGTRRELNVPFDEGVNVRIAGSNIEFCQYVNLLQKAASAVGVKWSYFADPHDSSNVTQAERYVRVDKDASGPVHARDGPLARMGHLMESDRHGHRKLEQRDMNERGEQLPGYRHQTAIDENRIQEIWPNHSLPKRFKHYYAREALSMPESHPLRHPKVGAIYYNSLWRDNGEKLGVFPDELAQLREELDEAVLGTLHDAGLSVTDTEAYIEDAYFDAELSDRERQIVELPLEDIKERQESVVIQNMAKSNGMSPIQWEALEYLVTDGGEVAPADIAESGGFHEDSVYRALDGIDELVKREYGTVELRSTYVGELVHDAVKSAKEQTRQAVEAGAKALEAAERGLDERTSAFVAWAGQYCESWKEQDEGVRIDFGRIEGDSRKEARDEIRRKLREGQQLWADMRNDEIKWRLGTFRAEIAFEKGPQFKSVGGDSRTVTQHVSGDIWREMTHR